MTRYCPISYNFLQFCFRAQIVIQWLVEIANFVWCQFGDLINCVRFNMTAADVQNRELGIRSLWVCPPGCLEQIKTARQDWLTAAPTFFRELNAFLIMLKFSGSYETYRICSQQYLHSIWIVFVCMGCWGWGVGCRSRHDGLTTDQDWPGQTHLSVCNWILT